MVGFDKKLTDILLIKKLYWFCDSIGILMFCCLDSLYQKVGLLLLCLIYCKESKFKSIDFYTNMGIDDGEIICFQ